MDLDMSVFVYTKLDAITLSNLPVLAGIEVQSVDPGRGVGGGRVSSFAIQPIPKGLDHTLCHSP